MRHVDRVHAGLAGGFETGISVLVDAALRGIDAQAPGGFQKNIGSRLVSRHILAQTIASNQPARPMCVRIDVQIIRVPPVATAIGSLPRYSRTIFTTGSIGRT